MVNSSCAGASGVDVDDAVDRNDGAAVVVVVVVAVAVALLL